MPKQTSHGAELPHFRKKKGDWVKRNYRAMVSGKNIQLVPVTAPPPTSWDL